MVLWLKVMLLKKTHVSLNKCLSKAGDIGGKFRSNNGYPSKYLHLITIVKVDALYVCDPANAWFLQDPTLQWKGLEYLGEVIRSKMGKLEPMV